MLPRMLHNAAEFLGRLKPSSPPAFYAMMIIALLGMGAAALGIVNGLDRLATAGRKVELGYQRIAALEAVLSVARDAETGQRGFLLTGRDRFLEPLQDAERRTPAIWAQVERLSGPEETVHIMRIRKTFYEKAAINQESISLARTHGLARAQAFVDAGTGRAKMDALRAQVGTFIAAERSKLNALQADTQRAYQLALTQAVIGSIGLLIAGALLYAAMREARRAAGKSAAELHDSRMRQRHLQDELAHIGRVNDMGEMAAAIAHEVNQPLTALSNYLSVGRRLAETGAKDQPDLPEILARANDQALRAGQIIRRIRGMVERRSPSLGLERLTPLIDAAVDLSRIGLARRQADIRYTPDPNAPAVLVDPVQFQQVLIILIRNAIEAVEAGPSQKLQITISEEHDAETGMWRIDVADNGPGMSADLVARIFQPFATSKPGNLGMGLSIAKRIMEQHEGYLRLTRHQGGATFSLYLPKGSKPN